MPKTRIYKVSDVASHLRCSRTLALALIKSLDPPALDLTPQGQHRNYRVSQAQLDNLFNRKITQ
jgi:hypothetical protein